MLAKASAGIEPAPESILASEDIVNKQKSTHYYIWLLRRAIASAGFAPARTTVERSLMISSTIIILSPWRRSA